ncbi:ABC-type transport system, involved in lipoprotein release, permease component [Prevotella dentalis DSM 3688]|uniref:ABC-type transport system, involved in lipoprotein release, permease component n=1 Tax=Prevotella dentalis (strain ATCC 49559 / DSM 3688 / JCM 13448 / NCTC 12043 / ES 2772) TaxID=908937 RepID=F9CZL5_PREDD|nr:FtsX-like permease family protein [Prevotella dentalis]AGB28067.1 ABC-type transport system, involved in lipoprotein release, permease component [Prevotella dentalis DSM 3688]EGQ17698.1 hypothetical protein HMPREF9136_0042 [Prevotella dentalis DSM 3688]
MKTFETIHRGLSSYLIFLSRNKAYTAINVFGLSLSLLFVLLIGVYTWQESRVDRQFTKADRIYIYGLEMHAQGVSELYTGGNWRLQKYFRSRYPEIESSCALANYYQGVVTRQGDMPTNCLTSLTDSTFFDMFDVTFVLGDRRRALADRASIVLTTDMATRLFGSPEAAINRKVFFRDGKAFRVTGVVQVKENTCLKPADAFIRFENIESINSSMFNERLSNATGAQLFFLVRPGSNFTQKENDMDEYQKKFFWIFQSDDMPVYTRLIPLNRYYFSGIQGEMENTLRQGDSKLVHTLFLVGLVILLFSVFNYINLTNAQSSYRAREMAMLRLLGSQRIDIVVRLILESIILCTLSMAVALLLAWAATPYVARLLDTTLLLSVLFHPVTLLLLVAFVLLLGLLAGLIPATMLSASKPIDVVRGTFRFRSHQWLGKAFIVVQSTVTIVLIATAFIMSGEIRHLIAIPRGYNTQGLMEVYVMDDSTKMAAWYDGLKQLSCVQNLTTCCGTPHSGGNNITFNFNGKTLSTQWLVGDEQYMKIFGLTLKSSTGLRGRNGEYYVNRRMLADEGLPLTSKFFYQWADKHGVGERETLSGIVHDFNIRGLGSRQHPMVVKIARRGSFQPWATVIQIQGDPVEAYQQVQQLFKRIFHEELDLDEPYLDQKIAAEYKSETRIATIVRLFALIAVVISLLGLVAMSTYHIQQHRRELAVRKVFGSSGRQVRMRLVTSFLAYVGMAFVIAVPVVWYFMADWLSRYPYRITWWPWLPVAGLIVLAVSFCAVAIQSWAASNENPVNVIKENQ